MKIFKLLALTTAVAALCFVAAPTTQAQVRIGVNIGPEPGCPYGYYDYAPYNCAPYGYYGPEWFNGGVFLGAGPWFHGPSNFHGNVNNHFDPQHGYHGALPARGAVAAHKDHPQIKGNEVRDGRGHSVAGKH